MEREVQVGQLVAGKYRIQQMLGRGGMGVVMAALHEHLNQHVALKFLTDDAYQQPEAVTRFQELKPELTTLDITMPEKDGLTALKEIIELDPNARVIMCSALGQESKVLESIKLGARDFVVKPFQAERVLEAVGKALA